MVATEVNTVAELLFLVSATSEAFRCERLF